MIKIFTAGAVLGMVVTTTSALAEPIIFSCRTTSGKIVSLSDLGANIRYVYGRAGQPDLAFIEPKRSSVTKSCRNDPNGGFFYHGLSVTHAGLTYEAGERMSVDPMRNFKTTSDETTLSVTSASGRILSTIRCINVIVDRIASAKVPDTMIGDCEQN